MVSTELIKVAKQEILNSKNISCDYLNKFLNDYTIQKKTGLFFNINIDACQYRAKLELKTENVLDWNYKTNEFIFVK